MNQEHVMSTEEPTPQRPEFELFDEVWWAPERTIASVVGIMGEEPRWLVDPHTSTGRAWVNTSDLRAKRPDAPAVPPVVEPEQQPHAVVDQNWITYDPNGYGIEFHDNETDAVAAATDLIGQYLDDTWDESVTEIVVAERRYVVVEKDRIDKDDPRWEEITGGRTDIEWWGAYELAPAVPPVPEAPERPSDEQMRALADRLKAATTAGRWRKTSDGTVGEVPLALLEVVMDALDGLPVSDRWAEPVAPVQDEPAARMPSMSSAWPQQVTLTGADGASSQAWRVPLREVYNPEPVAPPEPPRPSHVKLTQRDGHIAGWLTGTVLEVLGWNGPKPLVECGPLWLDPENRQVHVHPNWWEPVEPVPSTPPSARLDDLREEHCYIKSVDGCCFCGDSECDGISCIAALNPDDREDEDDIEHLHDMLRAGQAWQIVDRILGAGETLATAHALAAEALAYAENRDAPAAPSEPTEPAARPTRDQIAAAIRASDDAVEEFDPALGIDFLTESAYLANADAVLALLAAEPTEPAIELSDDEKGGQR